AHHQGIAAEESELAPVAGGRESADAARTHGQWRHAAISACAIELTIHDEGDPAIGQPGQFDDARRFATDLVLAQKGAAGELFRLAIPDPDVSERMPRLVPEKGDALTIG